MVRRIQRPTTTSSPLSRNGIRQPHERNAASEVMRAHQRQDAVGQEQADRHAHLRPARVEAAAPVVPGLQRHQDRTAPLAAEAQPLDEPQRHQHDRRPHPDRRVGRHQADRERGDAHHQQRDDEDVLAAELVAVVAEDHAAEGAGDEPHRVGREGQQGAHERLEAGEEQLVEHQRRGGAVDEEVVPLQRRPDQARDDDAAHRRRRGVGGAGRALGVTSGLLGWRPDDAVPTKVRIVQQWDKRQDQQDQVCGIR